METRNLGKSELKITPIIMGTWQAGKAMWVGIEDSEIIEALRSAYDAGITTFDTAEEYGEGYSERIVGEALAPIRDRVVLATKVWSANLKYDLLIEACDRSLKNLQTDYIDLYQIHWPSGSWGTKVVPIEETMRALNDLKQQGKIRAIGVSNFSSAEMEEASQYGIIDSLQPPYSLFWRDIEEKEMPYCVDNEITILAYSSLAQGLLTGKFAPNHQFAKGDHRANNRLFRNKENYDRVQQALVQLRPISDRYQCSLAQLALAWCIAQPQTCAIVGARNAEQATANALAAEIKLSAEDLAEIDAIGRTVTDSLEYNKVMWNFS
ncbi:MAG: aldo/keto reductase [Oscillatoria sp. SIO1A7]|nr:aldo/keto reductase [Oscillatoria sp. SIO1A7]